LWERKIYKRLQFGSDLEANKNKRYKVPVSLFGRNSGFAQLPHININFVAHAEEQASPAEIGGQIN
jgi:hypothetical protein